MSLSPGPRVAHERKTSGDPCRRHIEPIRDKLQSPDYRKTGNSGLVPTTESRAKIVSSFPPKRLGVGGCEGRTHPK